MTNDNDNDKYREFLTRLTSAVKEPAACASLLKEHRLDGRLRRMLETEQRDRVAMAYAIHSQAEEAGTLEQLVTAIKLAFPSIKSNDGRLVVLTGLIDYGKSGRQFASRDKAVMELLEDFTVDFLSAAKFIKDYGGLVQCAARWRAEKRGKSTTERPSGVCRNCSLADLVPETLREDGDFALASVKLVNKQGKKVAVTDSMKIPPLATAEEAIAFWRLIEKAVAIFSRWQMRHDAQAIPVARIPHTISTISDGVTGHE